MSRTMRWLAMGLGLGALALAGWLGRGQAQPAAPSPAEWKDFHYQNAASCMGCHAQPGGGHLRKSGERRALDVVLMTEYAIWKTHDKHAQAYAVLEGPRSKQMAERLKQDVLKKETGCLNCHALANLTPPPGKDNALDPKDGVSCGGCHGPSSKWQLEHARPEWRDKTPQEKHALGMRDLRDPSVRAAVCLSCHFGSPKEGKVVTHAMMAAGHPPLPPIEIATFSDNQPRHWRLSRSVPYLSENLQKSELLAKFGFRGADDVRYHQSRIAVLGGLAALRETAQLAQERAPVDGDTDATLWPELALEGVKGGARQRWPEVAMAHSDCFACHHDLRYPGFRQQRGFGYHLPGREPVRAVPGRPLVRVWPTALPGPCLNAAGQQDQVDRLEARLTELVKASNVRPYGKPADIHRSAEGLARWCDDALAKLSKEKYDARAALRLMHELCAVGELGKPGAQRTPYLPDHESARQIASLLTILYEDWSKAGGQAAEAARKIEELGKSVNVQPYFNRPRRLEITFGIITGGQNQAGAEAFAEYLKNIENEASLESMTNPAKPLGLFLAQVRGVSNEAFNAGLVKEAKRLQELSDEEQKKLLAGIAAFEPRDFLKALREIDQTLPKP